MRQALGEKSSIDFLSFPLRKERKYIEALCLIFETLDSHGDSLDLDEGRMKNERQFYARKIWDLSKEENVSEPLLKRIEEIKKKDFFF